MKLIFCKKCQDVFKLWPNETRTCKCGACEGAYESDELNAWYKGEDAVPLGFANSTLGAAIRNQPDSGMGEVFTAFVIPKEVTTMKKLK
jgi:hypothetical protein